MLDFNHGSGIRPGLPPLERTTSDIVNEAIDAALMAKRAAEPERTYLGASAIGDPCERKLQYSYMKAPIDPGRALTGRSLRIFATGHAAEDVSAAAMEAGAPGGETMFRDITAKWMEGAGFKLERFTAKGGQIGFSAMGRKFAGHIDGKMLDGPAIPGLSYACGWEHKALNTKNWSKIKKHGLKAASPVYYGQIQIYEGYMEIPQFLFTALNKNTQEMHHEVINFNVRDAQEMSDKAVRIIEHAETGQLLGRVASNPDHYLCKFCDWAGRCWKQDV